MTTPITKEIGQAAAASMREIMSRGLTSDDRAGLERLHREAACEWRSKITTLWCGVCLAAAYRNIGYFFEPNTCVDLTLQKQIARYLLPSTLRFTGHHTRTWETQQVEPPIQVAPEDVRAGDILLVRPLDSDGNPRTDRPYGDHFAMATGPMEDGVIPTIAGNESSRVQENTRTLDELGEWEGAPTIFRPALSWLEGAYLEELT